MHNVLAAISQGCFLAEQSRNGLGDSEVKTRKGRTPFRAASVLKVCRAFVAAKKEDAALFEMFAVSSLSRVSSVPEYWMCPSGLRV